MKKLFILLAMLFLLPTASFALTANVSSTTITLSYTEPSTNEDGSALNDLDHTTAYYDLGNGPVTKNIPATSPVGGGVITIDLAIPVATGQADVKVWATATDASGNISAPSDTITKRIDRLPPAAPK